ncbi:MAG: hypothetical protein WA746_16960, partial [Isosphaeraceae bacterium]
SYAAASPLVHRVSPIPSAGASCLLASHPGRRDQAPVTGGKLIVSTLDPPVKSPKPLFTKKTVSPGIWEPLQCTLRFRKHGQGKDRGSVKEGGRFIVEGKDRGSVKEGGRFIGVGEIERPVATALAVSAESMIRPPWKVTRTYFEPIKKNRGRPTIQSLESPLREPSRIEIDTALNLAGE